MDLYPVHDFVTSSSGQLENVGSLSSANVGAFHYKSNNHIY
jgi:hypothetical protein